ncbi:MAG: TIGR04053 family radical SAM/SPASM domain-containing protein [Nitrospinota bacterium]
MLSQRGRVMKRDSGQTPTKKPLPTPRLVAWESTRACRLACVHCRASAQPEPDPRELTTEEALRLVDEIAEVARPIFIVSGGDPLLRADVFDVCSHARDKGFKVVMSPSGTDLNPEIVARLKASGVTGLSISLDGSCPEVHDSFRQVPGAFERTVAGIGAARGGGLPFQINTTVTRRNMEDLPAMFRRAVELGAETWDVFMLVPTGRGKVEDRVSGEEYEEILRWVYQVSREAPIHIKVTCGPHYKRVSREMARSEGRREGVGRGRALGAGKGRKPGAGPLSWTRGCMAGDGFCFISHLGDVCPCGYFPIPAGNIRESSFRDIYYNSKLFKELRDYSLLEGRCGVCEYKKLCGGCRARALAVTGSYLGEEPDCIYRPRRAPR